MKLNLILFGKCMALSLQKELIRNRLNLTPTFVVVG